MRPLIVPLLLLASLPAPADHPVKGGFIVQVGCGEPDTLIALRANDRYLVHGLDTDAEKVAKARAHLRSRGLHGKISASVFDGKSLPFAENVVNLLVVKDGTIPEKEILRVLAPRGIALVDGKKIVKPVPEDIDEWPHFLHGPDNNAVAHDTQVGPPRRLRWMSDPLWTRYHHTLNSISAVVTGGGRIFYIFDESPASAMDVPSVWHLYARDAFSGVFLWRKPITSWASHQIRFRSGPVDLPRRLVTSGDLVFVTLSRGGSVSVLDAATGDLLRTLEGTDKVEEIIFHKDVLLLVKGDPEAAQKAAAAKRREPPKERQAKKGKQKKQKGGSDGFATGKDILAFDPRNGKLLWKTNQEAGSVMPVTLAAAGDRVFFQGPEHTICLGFKDGKEQWRAPRKARPGASYYSPTLVVADGVVLSAAGSDLQAFSAEDGKSLWNVPCKPTVRSAHDVLVVDGTVWIEQSFAKGYDLRTGKETKTNPAGELASAGHHHRCYRNKATDRYIIGGHRGMEFYDLKGNTHSRNNWVRGTCQYGMMPANGLSYAPAHSCGCYPESKLFGFYALDAGHEEISATNDLVRGPAFGKVDAAKAGISPWPTLRCDTTRSGSIIAPINPKLEQTWKAEIGGKLSALTVADDGVFVSAIDEHTVHCLDANTGKKLWSYATGGRVDSPPTIHKGLALFGSADGQVYALRASDGALAWRFRAAPKDRRTVVRDRVESVWPVHGSVLVLNGVAYVSAGRSSWLDGGIWLYGLEPDTGKVVCRTRLESEHPVFTETLAKKATTPAVPQAPAQNKTDWKTAAAPDRSDAFSIAGGTTSDILVSDGSSIYIRNARFDAMLQRQENKGRHLYSTSSLLDGNENHRSHWMIGNFEMSRLPVAYSWVANKRGGRNGVGFTVPYGLMLSFDDKTAWCVWRSYGKGKPLLFARSNRPFSAKVQPKPDFGPMDKADTAQKWTLEMDLRPRAMLRADNTLVLAGIPDRDTVDAYKGKEGGRLVTVSAKSGEKLEELKLEAPPVWDGLAAAPCIIFIAMTDGTVRRFE